MQGVCSWLARLNVGQARSRRHERADRSWSQWGPPRANTRRPSVRLYFYSSELHTFVEAKWAKTTVAAGGILLGTIQFFGVINPYQSAGFSPDSHSARALAAEDHILRTHLNMMSPRLDNLELMATQMDQHVNSLRALLHRRSVVGDTIRPIIKRAAGFHP